MLTRIDLRGRRDADPLPLLPRAVLDVAAGTDLVRPTVEDVRARGLDTKTAQWLSVDPVESEPRYGYAGQRPTRVADPSGVPDVS